MIDPHETPEDKRRHELFQCYRRGWKHGVCGNAKDRRFLEHPRCAVLEAYARGYDHGQAASIIVAAEEAERLGYDPRFSILRSPAPAEPPKEMSDEQSIVRAREHATPEACAVEILKCAFAWEPEARILGEVRAADIAALAAHLVDTCPRCGSTAWVNIDCPLCTLCHELSYG